MGFFSWAFLVFLLKESKKRRQKTARQIDGGVSFTAGQFARCQALNEPPVRALQDGPRFEINTNWLQTKLI